jgi:peptidoglycan/LPS O-acetylase OafA/YrhL
MPVAAVLVAISTRLGMGVLSYGYLKVVTVFTLTVIVASLSWKFFESPLIRLRGQLS